MDQDYKNIGSVSGVFVCNNTAAVIHRYLHAQNAVTAYQ